MHEAGRSSWAPAPRSLAQARCRCWLAESAAASGRAIANGERRYCGESKLTSQRLAKMGRNLDLPCRNPAVVCKKAEPPLQNRTSQKDAIRRSRKKFPHVLRTPPRGAWVGPLASNCDLVKVYSELRASELAFVLRGLCSC